MLDAVFNHTGADHPMWLDIREKGQESEYADWYMINKWPVEHGRDTRDGRYYSFAFAEYMPKLNTNNPAVQDYLLDIIRHSFLKAIRYMTSHMKDDFYLLGEIWHDSISWLQGDEYDSVMNYPLTTAIADFWVYKNRGRETFEYDINRCFTMYYSQVNDVLPGLPQMHAMG